MRLAIITTLLVLFHSFSTNGQIVYSTTPNGLKYKMFTHEKGPKPRLGDVIKFNFMLYNDKDSLLVSTFKSVVPVTTKIQPSSYKGDLEEAFMMMSKGDSGIFLVSADSFYSGQDMPVRPGSMLKMRIKMINVESPAEFEKERAKAVEEYNRIKEQSIKDEHNKLDAYMKKNAPGAVKSADGFYYIIEKQGTGPNPKENQMVTIHYTGSTYEGKVVETDSGKTTSFQMGDKQVIPGWSKGVALLNKGAKARFYIPSDLAYGERGVGNIIQPNTTLIYEIELVDIR